MKISTSVSCFFRFGQSLLDIVLHARGDTDVGLQHIVVRADFRANQNEETVVDVRVLVFSTGDVGDVHV